MTPYRPARAALRRLTAVANGQGGYFTAKQAQAAGYDYPHLVYHIDTGNFERVGHGIYRLPSVRPAEHDDLIRLTLWSRARDDRPQAVVSHETALALHELSDVLPSKTHVTVPKSFRKTAPRGCVLHKAAIQPGDIEEREGFRITGPLRTLLDVADYTSQDQLEKAVRQALERGLVRRRALDSIVSKHGKNDRLSRVLALVDNRP
ncbi:MAG: hypothetical protein DCC65_10715 [Planctomycetota bacterium]|nr:MAG: hypothetical protein DCC65_10715 [Planctomycetota bacterium]